MLNFGQTRQQKHSGYTCAFEMAASTSYQKYQESNGSDSNLTLIDSDGNLQRTNKLSDNTKAHLSCQKMVQKSCSKALYVKVLLDGLKKLGCNTGIDETNIVCEPCVPKLYGAFDTENKEVVVCENNTFSQKFMDDLLTHELIHAYDVCRVKFRKENLNHLACTSIRVANLSGDCFFWKENFLRFRFGWRSQQQRCVRNLAVKNMMCSSQVTEEKAREIIDNVFEACFNDHEPFIRIPP